MTTKKSEKLHQELEYLVDETGRLQAAANKAQETYKAQREKLISALEKAKKIDKGITAAYYHAILSLDWRDEVDPNKFIKLVESPKLREELLSVRITAARKRLKKSLQTKLFKHTQDTEPTLHVSKL